MFELAIVKQNVKNNEIRQKWLSNIIMAECTLVKNVQLLIVVFCLE